jgi:single-strand selective monofunctional uracil DNA glycosylase
MNLLAIADALAEELKPLRFCSPVTHVYNPLEYARLPYRHYVHRYGRGAREVILLGMNPGPWGMVQTGVPFGEVGVVRDWLGIKAKVTKPANEHPKRPVLGFACTRSEVSGARLWGWARDSYETPEAFFRQFFVANYCPLAFFEETGRNRTPDCLRACEREPLFEVCDRALQRTVEYLKPRYVVGVGKFAENRAKITLADQDVNVGGILHPSPASPAANRNWVGQATRQLAALGVSTPGIRAPSS